MPPTYERLSIILRYLRLVTVVMEDLSTQRSVVVGVVQKMDFLCLNLQLVRLIWVARLEKGSKLESVVILFSLSSQTYQFQTLSLNSNTSLLRQQRKGFWLSGLDTELRLFTRILPQLLTPQDWVQLKRKRMPFHVSLSSKDPPISQFLLRGRQSVLGLIPRVNIFSYRAGMIAKCSTVQASRTI